MITFLLFIFILGVLVMVHECGHYLAARSVGVRVEEFSLGFGPVIFKKKKGPTQYQISAIPLGGFVKLAGDTVEEYKGACDEYFAQKPGKRFLIIASGPALNYLLGFFFFWFIFWTGYPTLTAKVAGVLDGYGAQAAGIKAGDTILSVAGAKVSSWEGLQRQVQRTKGASSVQVTVQRDTRQIDLTVPLLAKQVDDQWGKKKSVGILGVTPFDEVVIVRRGPLAACIEGARKTADITMLTYQGIGQIISGKVSLRESMTGPLGIFFITSKAVRLGVIAVLHLIAVLSISLALFNLLPLPVLDGGHIFLLGIEKIRGKGLGKKSENMVNKAGFSLIITLAVLATYNDIMRIFGERIMKWWVR